MAFAEAARAGATSQFRGRKGGRGSAMFAVPLAGYATATILYIMAKAFYVPLIICRTIANRALQADWDMRSSSRLTARSLLQVQSVHNLPQSIVIVIKVHLNVNFQQSDDE